MTSDTGLGDGTFSAGRGARLRLSGLLFGPILAEGALIVFTAHATGRAKVLLLVVLVLVCCLWYWLSGALRLIWSTAWSLRLTDASVMGESWPLHRRWQVPLGSITSLRVPPQTHSVLACFEIVHSTGRLLVSSRIEGMGEFARLLRLKNPAVEINVTRTGERL